MSDFPPDLPRLRTLETYLVLQLGHVRAAIERAEREAGREQQHHQAPARDTERQQRDRPAAREAEPFDINDNGNFRSPKQGQPPETRDDILWWKLEPADPHGIVPHPAYVHRGDCIGKRGLKLVNREDARLLLLDVDKGKHTALPCPKCRPDIGLDLPGLV